MEEQDDPFGQAVREGDPDAPEPVPDRYSLKTVIGSHDRLLLQAGVERRQVLPHGSQRLFWIRLMGLQGGKEVFRGFADHYVGVGEKG
jgi:hypothetical protein